MTRAALLALGGLLFGCAPSVSVGFESPDPQGRVIALAKAAENPAEGDIPSLIGALDSADSAQRLLAINALERLTGETMGYRHFDAPWRRARAVERWAAWWEQRQGDGEAISASGGGSR
jgi:hypothetical protein